MEKIGKNKGVPPLKEVVFYFPEFQKRPVSDMSLNELRRANLNIFNHEKNLVKAVDLYVRN